MKRSPMKRSGRLRQQSAKRAAERDERAWVREDALHRAGHRCCAIDIVPEVTCWGPLDVDEIRSRGVNPGGHLDTANTQVLCRAHHDWRHAHPAEARARGLRRESWES
jgi:hypothetical protein